MNQIKTYPTYSDYKATRTSEAKEAFLRDNYQRLTDKQMAWKMGIPEHEIRTLLRELGLKRQKIAPPVEAKPEAPKPARYKKQSERDRLESTRSEPKIRMMYASQEAGLPRNTPKERVPRWALAKALAKDPVTGEYLLDYETVITALVP